MKKQGPRLFLHYTSNTLFVFMCKDNMENSFLKLVKINRLYSAEAFILFRSPSIFSKVFPGLRRLSGLTLISSVECLLPMGDERHTLAY